MVGLVCVASRTMLITGQNVFRAPKNKPYLEKWANSRGALAVEGSTEAKLWPEVFREAGYDTFLTGKWHNNHHSALKGFSQAKGIAKGMYETFDPSGSKKPGYDRPRSGNDHWTPWDRKFTGHWAPFVRDIVKKDGVKQIGNEYTAHKHSSELFADNAVEFLRKRKGTDKPSSCTPPSMPRTIRVKRPRNSSTRTPRRRLRSPKTTCPNIPLTTGRSRSETKRSLPFPDQGDRTGSPIGILCHHHAYGSGDRTDLESAQEKRSG